MTIAFSLSRVVDILVPTGLLDFLGESISPLRWCGIAMVVSDSAGCQPIAQREDAYETVEILEWETRAGDFGTGQRRERSADIRAAIWPREQQRRPAGANSGATLTGRGRRGVWPRRFSVQPMRERLTRFLPSAIRSTSAHSQYFNGLI